MDYAKNLGAPTGGINMALAGHYAKFLPSGEVVQPKRNAFQVLVPENIGVTPEQKTILEILMAGINNNAGPAVR